MVKPSQKKPFHRKATRLRRNALRWLARRRWNWFFAIFFVLFALGFSLLVASIFFVKILSDAADRVTLSVGLITGGIIWWQGHLIKKQMELETIIDLYKEWNSREMIRKRWCAWTSNGPNPNTIEDVLEFLEKVSTLEKNGTISRGIIWDTFGWYLWRYYFYCRSTILEIQKRSAPVERDRTLYQDLRAFFPKLLNMEVAERNCYLREPVKLTTCDLRRELRQTMATFIESEKRPVPHD